MRGKSTDFTPGPREKRRFVDGREIAGPVSVRPNELGGRVAIFGETPDKLLAKRVELARVAVVKQVPNHLDAVAAARTHKGPHGGEVVFPPLIDERPAD